MPALTNPVQRDEWARSQGYDGWNQYIDSGGSLAKAQGGSGDFSTNLQEQLKQVEQYANELIGEAQNNFDFITKFLDKQHAIALGNDDDELAKFYETVANSLEKKIGRIPYDFQQRTEREKQDLQNELQSIAEQRQLVQDTSEFEKEQETQARRAEFNRRGLLDSGIEAKRAEQQERARQLALRGQMEPLSRQEALSRLISTRNLADITTGARRDIEDTQFNEQQQREKAQLNLDEQLANIRRQKAQEELSVRSLLAQQEELNRLNA